MKKIIRDVINKVGYDNSDYLFDYKSCKISSYIHESPDINQGVDKEIPEIKELVIKELCLVTHVMKQKLIFLNFRFISWLLIELANLRRKWSNKISEWWFESQVTIQYSENNKPEKIKTIVLSTQHDDFDSEQAMLNKIKSDIKSILIPRLLKKYQNYSKYFSDKIEYINHGKFVIEVTHSDET